METNANTDNRRRIEDMTLSEIKSVKGRLEDRIGEAIQCVVDDFHNAYDLGAFDVQVGTDIRTYRTECGEKIAPSFVKYNVNVHFRKEDI